MKWIICAITWVAVGMLSFLAMCIIEMRGKKYDKNYFDDAFYVFVCTAAIGYLAPVVIVIAITDWHKMQEKFTMFIYNLANIGLKEQKDDD